MSFCEFGGWEEMYSEENSEWVCRFASGTSISQPPLFHVTSLQLAKLIPDLVLLEFKYFIVNRYHICCPEICLFSIREQKKRASKEQIYRIPGVWWGLGKVPEEKEGDVDSINQGYAERPYHPSEWCDLPWALSNSSPQQVPGRQVRP